MDCNKIFVRLAEIRKASRLADKAIRNGDNINCELMLDVINVHIQAVRAEMRNIKGQRG